MKEHSFAVSVSLVFHIVIVALFLHVPFDQYIKPKIMVLDFALEKERTTSNGEVEKSRISNLESRIGNQNTSRGHLEEQHEKQLFENRNTMIKQEEDIRGGFAAESLLMKQNRLDAVVSDPAGEVAIRGKTGSIGAKSEGVTEKNISVGGDSHNLLGASSSKRIIDYSKGGSNADNFPFIGDTIKKRFKDRYPDRARRMGWEGKVLASFVISEDGTIHDLKIVDSSGRRDFDEHAMNILAKTIFPQKLPYSLQIENWLVEYKLQ